MDLSISSEFSVTFFDALSISETLVSRLSDALTWSEVVEAILWLISIMLCAFKVISCSASEAFCDCCCVWSALSEPLNMASTADFGEFLNFSSTSCISWVESWVREARVRTSSATTAKPRPCSPARAASMAAFSASKLVSLRCFEWFLIFRPHCWCVDSNLG